MSEEILLRIGPGMSRTERRSRSRSRRRNSRRSRRKRIVTEMSIEMVGRCREGERHPATVLISKPGVSRRADTAVRIYCLSLS